MDGPLEPTRKKLKKRNEKTGDLRNPATVAEGEMA